VRLVFLGPPGAGKGTQAAIMAERFGLKHASTGDIFRQAAAAGSELGSMVREYLDTGKLVPDEVTSRVVEEMVVEAADSYILDGYPRTLPQARDLEGMLQKRSQTLDMVVYFQLGEQAAIERLTGRMVCSECGKNYHRRFMPPAQDGVCDKCGGRLKVRSDSSESVVKDRLAEYDEKTRPLVEFYQKLGLLKQVDASPAAEEVTRATEALMQSLAEE